MLKIFEILQKNSEKFENQLINLEYISVIQPTNKKLDDVHKKTKSLIFMFEHENSYYLECSQSVEEIAAMLSPH